MPSLGMAQTEFARHLGVWHLTISDLIHEKRAFTPETAARLGKLLGTSPESWLAIQAALDLWEINQDPERLRGIRRTRRRRA